MSYSFDKSWRLILFCSFVACKGVRIICKKFGCVHKVIWVFDFKILSVNNLSLVNYICWEVIRWGWSERDDNELIRSDDILRKMIWRRSRSRHQKRLFEILLAVMMIFYLWLWIYFLFIIFLLIVRMILLFQWVDQVSLLFNHSFNLDFYFFFDYFCLQRE